MKKIIIIFTLVCVLSLGFFTIVNQNNDSSIKNQSVELLVANNVNGVFDPTFASGSHTQYTIPAYCPALPFEDISKLEALSSITNVYPYYSLYIFEENENVKTTFTYWSSDEEHKQTLAMPIMVDNGDNQPGAMKELWLKLVTDQERFNDIHEHSKINSFLKKFDCQSGIYISDFLYKQLDIDEDASQLTIQVPVQVPVIAEMVDPLLKDHTEDIFKLDEYTAVKYVSVDVTMEVAGVINTESGVVFCQGLGIVVPYEFGKEIYESVDRSAIHLDENQMLWEPNTYIIKCQDGATLDDLGQEILSEIGQVYIRQYGYDNAVYYLSMLYNNDGTYSFMN